MSCYLMQSLFELSKLNVCVCRFPLCVALKSCVLPYIQATAEGGSSDEEMDDDAMIALDKGLATLFSAHKKNAEAKKDEKTKIQKEKTLVRDFKIKVTDPGLN